MKKLANGIWIYRNNLVCRGFGGYTVECESISLNVYKTLKDAAAAINKYMDGTNKIEPRIIGEIYYNEETESMEMKRNKTNISLKGAWQMSIYYNYDATDEEISKCLGDYYGCEICVNQERCFLMLHDKLETALKEAKTNV